MKRILKKLTVNFVYYLKIYKLIRMLRNLRKNQLFTILVYHSFSNNIINPFKLDRMLFEKQLEYLKNNFNVIRLGEVIEKVKNGIKLEKNTICITIDDGFLDNYKYAYPLLKKHSMEATIFITAGYIEGEEKNAIKMSCPAFTEVNGRNEKSEKIYRLPKMPMMSWEHVKRISNDNIEIGAHTINHPILTMVPIDIAEKEISSSKTEIERIINKEMKLFAFPNGKVSDYNDELCKIVKDNGYDAAFTVQWGINTINDNLYALKRIPISNLKIPEFSAKVNCLMSDP